MPCFPRSHRALRQALHLVTRRPTYCFIASPTMKIFAPPPVLSVSESSTLPLVVLTLME